MTTFHPQSDSPIPAWRPWWKKPYNFHLRTHRFIMPPREWKSVVIPGVPYYCIPMVQSIGTKKEYDFVVNSTYSHYEEIARMKRFNQDAQKAKGKWVASSDFFLNKLPAIDQLLTDAWWDDGKPRDVCSLTIRVGKDSASVSVNDPENEASITTNGQTVKEALERLEAYVSGPNPSWRQWGKKKR